MVEAQDVSDDRAGGHRELAECAQVISLPRVSSANTLNNVLQAYKTMIRAEKGEKGQNFPNLSTLVSDILWLKDERNGAICEGLKRQRCAFLTSGRAFDASTRSPSY